MKWNKDFIWDKYFKQVDIYQGRSQWTAIIWFDREMAGIRCCIV